MYNIISNMIQHNWDNQLYGSEQQYIYYICSAVIILFLVMTYDLIKSLIEFFRFK